MSQLMIPPTREIAHDDSGPIRLSHTEALVMAIKNLINVCTAGEVEDLLNENPALLADDDNGTYSVWPGKL